MQAFCCELNSPLSVPSVAPVMGFSLSCTGIEPQARGDDRALRHPQGRTRIILSLYLVVVAIGDSLARQGRRGRRKRGIKTKSLALSGVLVGLGGSFSGGVLFGFFKGFCGVCAASAKR